MDIDSSLLLAQAIQHDLRVTHNPFDMGFLVLLSQPMTSTLPSHLKLLRYLNINHIS